MMRIMMVLTGCGYLDGSEIHEVVLTNLALQNDGFSVHIYALDSPQSIVSNHIKNEVCSDSRIQIEEAARIARGQILPLSQAKMQNYDAIVIPGGYGVAQNLCDFADRGEHMSVHSSVSALLLDAYQMKKPIAGICISPILIAKTLGTHGLKMTLGSHSDAAKIMEKWGARHEVCDAQECCVDQDHLIVTTPAYMLDPVRLPDIWMGIQKLSKTLKSWMKK